MNMIYEGLAQHGMAVFTHEQSAGRGQRGRSWASERGKNIAISVVISPAALALTNPFKLSASTALAVHDFFSRYAGEETSVKWPNDLYWRDRKAGGILIENTIRSNSLEKNNWSWAVIGIGININQHSFPEGLSKAVSLKQICGKEFDPLQLAHELCKRLQSRLQQLASEPFQKILHTYNESLFMRGEKVRLKKGTRVFEAVIKEVNEAGQLIARTTLEEQFSFGEIEWVL